MGIVYKDINEEYIRDLNTWRNQDGCSYVVATSGGFDPLHIGHVRCIQESRAKAYGLVEGSPAWIRLKLVVIVNGDGFLIRKKGKPFMPHDERMEIIAALQGVDDVVGWDDGSQTVTGAIGLIKPDFFMKGGDRDSSQNVPEFDLCEQIGCKVIFGVGGGKIQSSSDLIKGAT